MSDEEAKPKPEPKSKTSRRRKKQESGIGEDVANGLFHGCLWGCIMLPIQIVLEAIFDTRAS